MLSYPYILFIDTETSAKPRSWSAPAEDTEKWPHIVQIAWIVADNTGRQVLSRDFIIEAKDYSINKQSRKIHGISEELANQVGVARKEAMKALYRDLKRFKPLVVGHFITLDLNMVQAGFKRAGIKNIMKDYPAFCTMRATSEYMHMDKRQYPQLGELYKILFRKPPEQQHTAPGDARAVSEVFFELVRRGDVDDQVILAQARELKSAGRRKRKTGCGLPVILFILGLLFTIFIP